MGKILVIGETYEFLTILTELPARNYKRRYRAECRCGKLVEVDVYHVLDGGTKSCGCHQRDVASKHGHWRNGQPTPEYRVWCGMRNRCQNRRNKAYPKYGGRGITVCKSWEDFSVFLRDVGPRPSPKHTMERIDNDRGYEPGNCKWATIVEQNRNRRGTHHLTFRGVTRHMNEWAALVGLEPATVYQRLKRGWPVEDALTKPAGTRLK